jgi:hypothetical protein
MPINIGSKSTIQFTGFILFVHFKPKPARKKSSEVTLNIGAEY